MGPWTRWIVGTALWAFAACIVVGVVWGPDPLALAGTAAASVLISLILGNGDEFFGPGHSSR